MSDTDNRKIIGMVVECAKLTPEIFAAALEETLRNMENKEPQGKTSLNRLLKNGSVDNIEVNDRNIGSFAQTARKYNLTYALKRTQSEDGKKQYLVCFKGKDLETMQRAFKEYSYNQTHKDETLFSKKKVAEIQTSRPEKEIEGLQKQKERKKERSERTV